mmetsp:Transcript_20558/g.18194  ORF Transcript_20558/g.18194 Transcript_20558/m.18194 type:complete len:211 (+) Transcript_20558:108-740(+)
MENMAQPLNDMDNWTWMAAPVEADFPFQGQADWFMQGEWNGNSMQKYVNGWYVSQGFWGMRTEHEYMINDDSRHEHSYAFDANEMSALVQFNVEFMKWMFGNVYAKIALADSPLLKVAVLLPPQLNCLWDDECQLGLGFYISSMVNLWTTTTSFMSSTKACTGNFFELIDGAEFDELIVCKYRYPDRVTRAGASTVGNEQGWTYQMWWDF